MTFDELHDAIIQDLRLTDWMAGRVELRLREAGGQRLLVFQGMTSLKIGRLFEWGPSGHINSATIRKTENGNRVKIEVQSGDTVEIEFQSWEATVTAAG